MPPPVPPSVNDGRMMAGKPMVSRISSASSKLVAMPPLRDGEPDPRHRLAKQLSVFGDGDGLGGRADQLHAVTLERAVLRELHRDVERRLAAHRRQDRVGLLAGDDQLDVLRRHRLDVGPVGELRVGHDRRRIGVHEDDLVALLLERLRRLGAGIVELGALADDDRPGADDEDAMQVRPTRHESLFETGGKESGAPDGAPKKGAPKSSLVFPTVERAVTRPCRGGALDLAGIQAARTDLDLLDPAHRARCGRPEGSASRCGASCCSRATRCCRRRRPWCRRSRCSVEWPWP